MRIAADSYLISKDFNIIGENAPCRWLFLLDIQGVCGLLAQLGMAGVHQLREHSGQGAQVIEHLRKKSYLVRLPLRIRDILVRIRIRGSVPLWLMDSNPDPAQDPAIFVCELQAGN